MKILGSKILSKQRFVAFVCILLFSSLFIRSDVTEAASYVERVSGEDRIETAIQISQTGWDSADTVILARADNPADALSSASLSGKVDAPILLTYPKTLDQRVMEEIYRLGASKVYILGGTGAVSDKIASQLKSSGLTVKRLGGKTRFETAAIINNEAQTSLNSKALLVSGYATADALSAASNSSNHLLPIYLSTKTTIPVDLPSNVKEVTIYGGTGVVGTEVETQLRNKRIKVTRIAGATRYETNTKAADDSLTDNVIIVRGTSTNSKIEDYPDAVAGAGLAHKLGANIILVHPTVDIPTIADYFQTHRYQNVFVLGGEGAVSDDVVYNYVMLPDSTIKKTFDFNIVAADEAPGKPIMYFLSDVDHSIKSYNYETNELRSLNLPGQPEELYVQNNKIYITIVDQPHRDNWPIEEQTGHISIVNADTFQLEKTFNIHFDPFDIVVDTNGIMYISGGSDQFTDIRSYSSETGELLSSQPQVRQQSYIELSPNESSIYAIDTDLTPRDITLYYISDGKLTVNYNYYSRLEDYDLGQFMKMSPDGQYLFNNSGNVFDNRLNYAATLEVPFTGITFDLNQNRFFTGIYNYIFEHDYSTFGVYNYYLTNGEVLQTYYKDGKIVVLSDVEVSSTGLHKVALETVDVAAPSTQTPLSQKQLNTLLHN